MRLTRTEQGWVIRVPDTVVEQMGLSDGTRVTFRAVPKPEDEIRHFIAEMRGNLPDYPFDRWDWDENRAGEPA